ncbi:unnamed protein product [Ascophyllum nodosum]
MKCMRSWWLREPPLQAMMSSCTWDYFLTSDELGKFLGIKEDDLKPILSRVWSSAGDDTFLRTCGIRSRQFNRKNRSCLLDCGNLVTLEPKLCPQLLAFEPQPLYWGMTPWGVDASTNVMPGLESLGTIKTMVDRRKRYRGRCFAGGRCTSGVGAKWSFMRRESKARMILSRGAPIELGLNFECDVCDCIHLGESLPDTAVRDFGRTSLSNATEFFLELFLVYISLNSTEYLKRVSRLSGGLVHTTQSATPRQSHTRWPAALTILGPKETTPRFLRRRHSRQELAPRPRPKPDKPKAHDPWCHCIPWPLPRTLRRPQPLRAASVSEEAVQRTVC